MTEGTHEQFELTRAEALAAIKTQPRKTRFYVFVRGDAPIAGEPGQVFPGILSASIPVTRKAAADMVGKLLTARTEERGGRLPCSTFHNPEWDSRSFYLL